MLFDWMEGEHLFEYGMSYSDIDWNQFFDGDNLNDLGKDDFKRRIDKAIQQENEPTKDKR